MYKVLVVDDDKFTREGIVARISTDKEIEIIGCATNGLEAYKKCKGIRPDVVLMDLVMPDYDGIEGTRMIKSDFDEINVIILTTFCETDKIKKALDNGATGYVYKEIETDELIRVVKSSVFGPRMIHSNVFDNMIKKVDKANDQINNVIFSNINREENRDEKRRNVTLTEREKDILSLIVRAKSNREIASILFISEGRVKNIISNILEKYNFKDRTELAIYALTNRIAQ
ncbi:MAG: response regulator transcription factor [Bacillota bacterium]|nr:response regulator transcription factor [Bacillota bacterium]